MQSDHRDDRPLNLDSTISPYTARMKRILDEIQAADASNFRPANDVIKAGLSEIMSLAVKAYQAVNRR